MLVNSTSYNKRHQAKSTSFEEIPKCAKLKDNFLWVSMKDPTETEMRVITDSFNIPDNFHNDIMDGTMIDKMGSKLEENEENVLMIIRLPEFIEEELHAGTLFIFANKAAIVSITINSNLSLHRIRKNYERDKKKLGINSNAIIYSIVNRVVERIFPIISRLESNLNRVEDDIFTSGNQKNRKNIYTLYSLRQKVSMIKNIVTPLMEILFKLHSNGTNKTRSQIQESFKNVFDHLVMLNVTIESLRDTVNAAISVSLSLATIEDNEITKKLGAWAAIVAVPATFSSFWGMNFDMYSEVRAYGFIVSFFIYIFVGSLLLYIFKKNKWL